MIRSLLFMPGNAPGMMLKSDFLGADTIIYDLEDAVSTTEKDAARDLVSSFLREIPPVRSKAAVRINGISTPYWREDLRAVAPVLCGNIIVPKSESAEMIRQIDQALEEFCVGNEKPGIYALIETAEGVENAYTISRSSPNVKGLLLGGEDLTTDIGCRRSAEGTEIQYARCRIINAATAAHIPVYDTPHTDIEDAAGLSGEAEKVRKLGFSGKLAIHPSQIPVINKVFSPTEEELSYAREVMDVYRDGMEKGLGAISLHGKMIDAPVVQRARKLLAGVIS